MDENNLKLDFVCQLIGQKELEKALLIEEIENLKKQLVKVDKNVKK